MVTSICKALCKYYIRISSFNLTTPSEIGSIIFLTIDEENEAYRETHLPKTVYR